MNAKVILFILGLSSSSPAALEFVLLEQIVTSTDGDYPFCMTPDGNLLAGSSSSGTAATWNAQGQVTSKGPGAIFDVNADGTVFVGHTDDERPAIWQNGLNATPILATSDIGIAYTVSADGLSSAGTSNYHAVKFDHSLQTKTEIQFPSNYDSKVWNMTPDGSAIVGEWGPQYLLTKAFIKVGQNEYEDIGTLGESESPDYTNAYDVSDDGKIVVGISRGQVFRWERNTGMIGLSVGDLSSGYRFVSISGNGRTIVGNSYNFGTEEPSGGFVWDESHGVRDLKALIESAGIDLTGWFLETVSAISFNGDVIAGFGTLQSEGNEYQRGWVVRGFSQFLPPTILLNKEGAHYVVRFTGVLQESDDLGISDAWQDVSGNPTAQYVIPTPLSERRFYRARSY